MKEKPNWEYLYLILKLTYRWGEGEQEKQTRMCVFVYFLKKECKQTELLKNLKPPGGF